MPFPRLNALLPLVLLALGVTAPAGLAQTPAAQAASAQSQAQAPAPSHAAATTAPATAAPPPASAYTQVEVGNTTRSLEPQTEPAKATVTTHAEAAPSNGKVAIAPIDPKQLDATPLQALGKTVAALETTAGQATTDQSLGKVRDDAAAVETSATSLATTRAKTLAQVQQELKALSTKSGAPRPRLSAVETRERRTLVTERAQLVAQIKQAQADGAVAGETYNAVASKRRNDFTSRLFERTASPLEESFWGSLADSLGPDARRVAALFLNGVNAALGGPEPRGLISLAFGLVLAALIAFPARLRLKTLNRRRAAAAVSAGGLRRSAHALGGFLIDTVLPGTAALVLKLSLTWGQLLSQQADAMAASLVVAVFWGAAILSLSRQLAGASQADERLLPVSDGLAAHMRVLPWVVALITGSGFLLYRLNVVVGASVSATIAANCVTALAYASVATLVLLALGVDGEETQAEDVARAPGRMALSLALTAAIAVTVIAVFAGFSTLAALVARQIYWFAVLGGVAYLLIRFADDMVTELFKPHGWLGRPLLMVLSLRYSTVQQLGVLTSAVLQTTIALTMLSMALHPFGGGGDLFPANLMQAGHVIHVGSIEISPRSVGAGLLSLLIGMGIVHLVERWFDRRFLPVTEWDSGVRNSVSTGIRYLGVGLAILWALAAAGLGFKQIALVASALSVGIGFGLQQIVQNFVSGLILLVERPVKVGDWVNLGGVEGDVKRIRVRATEIETFDRTTIIVPNSDLITKQVQNKTLGDPRGRVTLKFSVGAATDAPRATEAALTMLAADEQVLKDPKPKVFIESLTEGGSVNFMTFAYVASQRDVLTAKSRLYGELIRTFGEQKIGFIGGPGLTYIEPGPELKAFVDELAAKAAERSAAAPPREDVQR